MGLLGSQPSDRSNAAVEDAPTLTAEQWQQYDRFGFLDLGRLFSDQQVAALKDRADDLALGRVANPAIQMQLDTGGDYEALPGAVPVFDQGTLFYRKIQGLESDDRFSILLQHPLFRHITARHYGAHATISIFRAMVMNKPAGRGTRLPWHQDGGDVWALDRDPLVTIWIALDPATVDNGCLEVIPGSHRLGVLTPLGSTLSDHDAERHCPPEEVHALAVEQGHAVLIHNWLIHGSGVNRSGGPRRAFTTCFMDARTRSTLTGDHFPLVAGGEPPPEHLYVRQLRIDAAALSESSARSEEYALSLLAENRTLHESIGTATAYARSLEAEIERLGTT